MLGANDGLLSISSLMLGVSAADPSSHGLIVVGLAGLIAGALSMGAGEFVSVSSQEDTEQADLDVERLELLHSSAHEKDELRDMYIHRGLDKALATQVATQLTAHDALGAHARDEIGITSSLKAKPLQAAFVSAVSFTLGGAIPLLAHQFAALDYQMLTVALISLVSLAGLGALAAYVGGASMLRGALRVLVWGAIAMAVTSGIGSLIGSIAPL